MVAVLALGSLAITLFIVIGRLCLKGDLLYASSCYLCSCQLLLVLLLECIYARQAFSKHMETGSFDFFFSNNSYF